MILYTNFFDIRLLTNYFYLLDQFKVDLLSLSRICRTIRCKFTILYFNCDFFIFPIICHFFDYLSSIHDRELHRTRGRRKRLSRVSRSPSNVISTFPIAVAYFRICFQFPFGKIPYKDGRSTRKFRVVISRWFDTIIKALNVNFLCE